jgi:diadenosine tetraphosphatase ApaH/serine/threonine PP2A family protein phosphatase
MRYAIVSDVHGNLDALTVVFDRLAAMDIDAYVFLGDAVGYGACPNEVCALLRERVGLALLGNHDAAVSGRMPYDDYYEAARRSLAWCTEHLQPSHTKWLASLPYRATLADFSVCHGSPFGAEQFDYLFATAQLREQRDALAALPPVTFIGHSHLTLSFRIDGEAITQTIASSIDCRPQARYIITVGSVGQPRDHDPRACCGVFDSDRRLFTFHRFEYDVHSARQKIIDAGLPAIFGDRLLVGL